MIYFGIIQEGNLAQYREKYFIIYHIVTERELVQTGCLLWG